MAEALKRQLAALEQRRQHPRVSAYALLIARQQQPLAAQLSDGHADARQRPATVLPPASAAAARQLTACQQMMPPR